MKKIWFRRMIWSYIPIFLSVGCFLFFVFFQILTEQNKKDALKANQVFTEQVQYYIDGVLQSIDYTFITEMSNNEWLRKFFDSSQGSDIYLLYQVEDRLKKIKQMNSLIDSVYLVRFKDDLVFNGNVLNQRELFPDNAFITEMKKTQGPIPWSNLRSYQEFSLKQPINVITLVRKSPDNAEKGMVVVNVSTALLKQKIAGMYNNKFRFVDLYDRVGHSLFGTKDNQSLKKVEIAPRFVSTYTGWEIQSDSLKGSLIEDASALSSFWTLLGFIAFTFGIASIVFVTRRNYKPINELLSRIRSYPTNKTSQFSLLAKDEFAFISSTLDEMREQSEKFQQQYEDDVRVRIKLFFHQLVNGFQNLSSADWTEAMESTGLPIDFHLRQVGIAELDQFSCFQQRYDRKDQDLIKFVISKALQEIMQQHQLLVWSEWTSKDQLSCMVTLCNLEDEERCKQAYEQLQVWVHDYLNQTLTIGLGSAVEEPVQLSISYKEAHKALQFKMVAGYNSILPYVTYGRRHTSKGDLLTYTPLLKKTIDLLGKDENTWKISLQQLFTHMNQDQLPREHIHIILHDYLYRLDSELAQYAKADMELWKSIELPRLQQVIDLSETLGEIHSGFMEILPKLFERVKATLEGNKTKELIQQVKEYIEQNFRKPDLSLEHLGQLFDMNPKYLSQLFKNGYGQGFIDFLINIRICQAQEYLIETDWEVQEIAEKVGYVNPISFRRTFKKTVGLSPGEFRKYKGRATLS